MQIQDCTNLECRVYIMSSSTSVQRCKKKMKKCFLRNKDGNAVVFGMLKAALWCEDSILDQWRPCGILGSSPDWGWGGQMSL